MSLSAASSRTADREARTALGAAAVDLRRWIRELRSLVVTITPPALHAQGLAASLSDLAATLELRGLKVYVDVRDTEGLDEATETLLYRAAQEAVRNIVRHAEATTVSLTVACEQEDDLVLRVRDDGRGIDSEGGGARRRGSVGLDLLAGLVAGQGGRLSVGGPAGAGTQLVVHLPVARPSGPPPAEPTPTPEATGAPR